MDLEKVPTGPVNLVLKGAGAVKRRAARPRLQVDVASAPGRSADLVLKNLGRESLTDVEVRVLDVEPCGACVQGGPRHWSQVVRVDARLPWPTGEAFGRLGPKTAESIHLCSVTLSGSDDVESTASIPLVGRDPIVVAVRATEAHYGMIDPSGTPDASPLALPPDYAYLMDAPARIRLAVAAKDRPPHVVTVAVAASRHVASNAPMWMQDQSVTFSISEGSLDPHPMVGTDFPPRRGAPQTF